MTWRCPSSPKPSTPQVGNAGALTGPTSGGAVDRRHTWDPRRRRTPRERPTSADDDLSSEGFDGTLAVAPEGNCKNDHVASDPDVGRCRGPGLTMKRCDQLGHRVGPSSARDRDTMPASDEQAHRCHAELAAADDPDFRPLTSTAEDSAGANDRPAALGGKKPSLWRAWVRHSRRPQTRAGTLAAVLCHRCVPAQENRNRSAAPARRGFHLSPGSPRRCGSWPTGRIWFDGREPACWRDPRAAISRGATAFGAVRRTRTASRVTTAHESVDVEDHPEER